MKREGECVREGERSRERQTDMGQRERKLTCDKERDKEGADRQTG